LWPVDTAAGFAGRLAGPRSWPPGTPHRVAANDRRTGGLNGGLTPPDWAAGRSAGHRAGARAQDAPRRNRFLPDWPQQRPPPTVWGRGTPGASARLPATGLPHPIRMSTSERLHHRDASLGAARWHRLDIASTIAMGVWEMHLTGRRPPAPQQRDELLAAVLDDANRFDLVEVCGRLGTVRGRQIELLPVFGRAPRNGCQPWIVGQDADYVLAEENTTAMHRDLLALHTMAHVLLGHPGRPVEVDQVLAGRILQSDWRRMRPLLGPAYAAYAAHAVDEAAADYLAVQVLQRAGRLPLIDRQPWPTNPPTRGRRA